MTEYEHWLQSEIVTLDAAIERQLDRGASAAELANDVQRLTRLTNAWDVLLEHERSTMAQGVSGS